MERLLANFKTGDEFTRKVAGLPRRILGRTGQEVSIIGFPGLALARETEESSRTAVQQAWERGINYFDVAPAYGKDGECEIKLGKALESLDRKKIFLSCKTKARDKEGSRAELERSLERLKTDHFDLYQMHHLVTAEEVRRSFGPGGAIETFRAAREEGKIKWIGFSAHSTRSAVEALKVFAFDTVMFPLTFADFYLRDFGPRVLEAAAEREAAVIAIKPTSKGAWPKGAVRSHPNWYRSTETPEEFALALRFALSLRGVVAGIPTGYIELLNKTVDAAAGYTAATTEDKEQLRKLAKDCVALFTREDERGDSVAGNVRGPYPDHPYGFGTDHEA